MVWSGGDRRGRKGNAAVGRKFGARFELSFGRIGGNAIDEVGTPLPQETTAMCEKADAILFGAVGGPKWDDPEAKVRPEDGILAIRKNLGLFANIRPSRFIPLSSTQALSSHSFSKALTW